MAFAQCTCGEKQELVDMSTIERGEYTAIIWEDRTYMPFCVIPKNDCGTQIGYLNGDADDRVCEYKDYPSNEWMMACNQSMSGTIKHTRKKTMILRRHGMKKTHFCFCSK